MKKIIVVSALIVFLFYTPKLMAYYKGFEDTGDFSINDSTQPQSGNDLRIIHSYLLREKEGLYRCFVARGWGYSSLGISCIFLKK